METYFVTGGAGFIGSHLAQALLERGKVIIYDDFSLGRMENLSTFKDNPNLKIIKADLLDAEKVVEASKGVDVVFHLAANSDISNIEKTDTDLKVGTLATYNVLEAMRANGIKRIVFSSSSAIYGEATKRPTKEDYGPLLPISFYGTSKLSCEALVSAFSHGFDIQAWMFRFANIIGSRGTHGILVDFVEKLRSNPNELEILGDGTQRKPYLEVRDLVSGILFGFDNAKEQMNLFNLGVKGHTSVKFIADTIILGMGLKDVSYRLTGGDRGWRGDVPQVELSVDKMSSIGWTAKHTSDEAVQAGVKAYLEEKGLAGGG